jgi:hypothetical protein
VVVCTASGTFIASVNTGSMAATTGAVTSQANGTFLAPVFTGNAVATLSAVSAAANGQYTSSSVGTASIVAPTATAAASGTFLAFAEGALRDFGECNVNTILDANRSCSTIIDRSEETSVAM